MNASNEPPLPEMIEETVDATTLAGAFARASAAGKLLQVVVKEALTARAQPPRGPEALDEARDALAAGRLNGVQLRYLIGDVEWWDTIMAVGPDAWRVVRIARDA